MVARGDPRRHRTQRRRRRTLALLAAVVAVVVMAVILTRPGPGGAGTTGTTATTQGTGRGASTTSPTTTATRGTTDTTHLGPDGVVSSAIVAENARPGTTAWRITAQPPTGYIQGWASTTDAEVGQRVGLYVTTTAPSFRVVAYRMGYYQGKGAREIWRSTRVTGQIQPPCPVTAGVNMVSCANWQRSLVVPVTKAFVQGDYLLKLTASTGRQGYVLLTVWDPHSTATYLVVARSLTEQGWNTYGGYDYYQGQGPCTLGQTGSYPPCNRARVVSFDRPYATGTGASDFFGNEFPLVQFMERHGLDVAYCTDVTVTQHPSTVLHHRALISLGHDETWTTAERDAAESALAQGVNLAFMSAAAIVRHARLQASPIGPDREEVDYRSSTEDPLTGTGRTRTVTGNTFTTPPTNWPPTQLVGGEYSGFVYTGAPPAPFVVYDATAWIFKGTGLRAGSSVPGVISSDIEHVNPLTAPGSLEVFGHSPIPIVDAYTNQGSWDNNTYSDMTYYTDPASQGGVFQSGTVSWISRLAACASSSAPCPAPMIARITGNLLRVFGQGPAGAVEPSVGNWQHVTPAGS